MLKLDRVALGKHTNYNNSTGGPLAVATLFGDFECIGAGADGFVIVGTIRDQGVATAINSLNQGRVELGVKYAIKFIIEDGDRDIKYMPEVHAAEVLRRSGLRFENFVTTHAWLKLRFEAMFATTIPRLPEKIRTEEAQRKLMDKLEASIKFTTTRFQDDPSSVGCYVAIMEIIDFDLQSLLTGGFLSIPDAIQPQFGAEWLIHSLPRLGLTAASIMAQTIAALIEVRRCLPALSHGDLHPGNVGVVATARRWLVYRLSATPAYSKAQALVLPLELTGNSILKLFDLGRLRTMGFMTTVPQPDMTTVQRGVPAQAAIKYNRPEIATGFKYEDVYELSDYVLRLCLQHRDRNNFFISDAVVDFRANNPNRLSVDVAREFLSSLELDGSAPAWVVAAEKMLVNPLDNGVIRLGQAKFIPSDPPHNPRAEDMRIRAQLESPDYYYNLLQQMRLLDGLRCENTPAAIKAKIGVLNSVLRNTPQQTLSTTPVDDARILYVDVSHAGSSMPLEAVAREIGEALAASSGRQNE
jgi:hypothetical protein